MPLPVWIPASLLFAGALVLFAIRSVHGIHFLTFGDESGHFLGARAIHAGDRLYRDFIDAHGPFVFMVAYAFGILFGWTEPLDARWAIVGFASLAAASVATSTVFKDPASRLWAAALFFGLIAAPWLVQALNMVNYHVLGGVCVTITLSWLVVPAWTGAEITKYRGILSGLCLALLCASAYSLAPSALLFATSAAISLRYGQSRSPPHAVLLYCLAGFLGGALIVLLWLLRYGDPVGYLVFHIIDNQTNYARYQVYGWRVTLQSLIPSLAPGDLVQSTASILCLTGFLLLLAVKSPGWTKRPVLCAAAFGSALIAVPMLNFRGAIGFQDGSFVVASIAIFSIALAMKASTFVGANWLRAWLTTACLGTLLCGVELTCRLAVNSPWAVARQVYVKWPPSSLAVDRQTPVYDRIRKVLRPDERLLVLVYNPDFFLPAGYLPIRKFHGYLPWEADYARAPWFNRTRDLCDVLSKDPPPVIVYDHWVVGGVWNPDDYIPCLKPLLNKLYTPDPIANLYIRRDRLPPP